MMLGTHELVASEFRSLSADVRDAGLLDRRPHYYGAKIAFTVAAFAAGWVGLFALRHSWVVLADAGFLGLMFTQLGFLAHDAGHLQIFQSRRANKLLGFLLANLLIGLSFGWWVPKHNAHHAHPNELGRDPDLGEGGVGGVARRDESAAPPSMLARHHAPVFFALMILRSTGMHVSGALRLLRQRDRPAGIESLLIAVHMVVYLGLLVWQLSPTKALAFIAVQQATFSFYLGLSFAPNHKGMPVITSDSSLGFAERQVVTARNLAGGRCITLMFGGLNYQIEHHLFPTMPRPNLARAQHLVRAFCSDSGLSYHEESLRGSFRAITESLRLGAVAAMPPQIDAIAVAAQPPGS